MASNVDTEYNLAIQEMSNYFLSPTGQERTDKFSEEEIQRIAELLSHSTSQWRSSWSSAPRVYCVLRLIGQESAMDKLMKEGITTDIWFPFSKRSLAGDLSPEDKDRFLAKQMMVETRALYLEKCPRTGRKSQHQYFPNDDAVPLIYEKTLGKGTFGEVHAVKSKLSHKVYARKQISRSKGFIKTKAEFKAFERERDIVMTINHHHCIEFIGSYTTPKYLGLLVSPVADIDLKNFLSDSQASYPQRNLLLRTFFGCLSRAFQFLHDINIRHRDLKPENILISEGRVKVSDFGLSLNWSDSRSTTTWSTCPGWSRRYCAPEVIQCQSRNSSSDIWSLGCVFLEMITVLKGRTVDDLLNFIRTYRTNHSDDECMDGAVCYYSEPEAIVAWTAELMANNPRDNEPIVWVNEMLDHVKENRPHATRMVEYTGREGKNPGWQFCGLCCFDDSDDEEGDAGFDPTADAFSPDVSISADFTDASSGLSSYKRQPLAEATKITSHAVTSGSAAPHTAKDEVVVQLPLNDEFGLEENSSIGSGRVGLHWAASGGHEEVVRLLLEKGADVEAKDKSGWTALYGASYNGQDAIVLLLLEMAADVEAKDRSGRTALYGAAFNGQEDVVRLLLERGADVEAKTANGWTALYGAAFNGREAVVRLLLDKGADIEAKTGSGRTALYGAALNGHEAVVRLLLERGADVEAKDKRGMTALYGAALNGQEAVVQLLQNSSHTLY